MVRLIAALSDKSYRELLAEAAVFGQNRPELLSRAMIFERVKSLLEKIAKLQQEELNKESYESNNEKVESSVAQGTTAG